MVEAVVAVLVGLMVMVLRVVLDLAQPVVALRLVEAVAVVTEVVRQAVMLP